MGNPFDPAVVQENGWASLLREVTVNAKQYAAALSIALATGSTPITSANAESVIVKYRGPVDLAPFNCQTITRSSLVRRICYDARERYMIINLNGTYYHYCEIGKQSVSALLNADSMGRYYNANIKGNFDCRVNRVPAYK